jgi:hypothetical protein
MTSRLENQCQLKINKDDFRKRFQNGVPGPSKKGTE